MESLNSSPEAQPEGANTSQYDGQGELHSPHAPQDPRVNDDALSFRLALAGLRDDLGSDEDDYTSQISTDSRAGTPPESPAQSVDTAGADNLRASHLDTDRNSLSISHHSSLDVRISFHAEQSSPPETGPRIPGEDPWITFLNDELSSTFSSGEHHTHRMLLILRAYFGVASPSGQYARWVAETLQRVSDEYLLCVGTWEVLEREGDLEGFLWLVWDALLEVVVRMDYAGDDQEAVVLLVRELLRTKRRREVTIVGVSAFLVVPVG